MANDTKDRTVNYRHAELTDKEENKIPTDLESLFRSALEKTKGHDSIQMPYGEEDAYWALFYKRKTGEPYNRQGCACGALSFYEKGKLIPLIDPDEQGDEIYETRVEPRDLNNNPRKLEEHTFIFVIRKNHLAVVAPAHQSINILESFFNWLFIDATALINGGVRLVNIPVQEAIKKAASHKIKGFSFRGSAYKKADVESAVGSPAFPTKKQTKRIIEENSIVCELLQIMRSKGMFPFTVTNKDKENIKVAIEITYRSSDTEENQDLLLDYSRHLGGIDGLDTAILLDGNSRISNEELTVRGKVALHIPNGNIEKLTAYTEIANWLVDQMRQNKIPSDV